MVQRETHIVGDDVLVTEVHADGIFTIHMPDPDYKFIHGCKFNEEGEIEAQQVEWHGERMIV